METTPGPRTLCIAFEGTRCLASGELIQVAAKAKEVIDGNKHASVLIFDELTSQPIEVDFRGTAEDVVARILERAGKEQATGEGIDPAPGAPRSPGRPKLGVVAREVTLLPRHWEWLNDQPGGASVALRKLVEAARLQFAGKDAFRHVQESAYRFMSAMAGNESGFEEATRAFFRGNRPLFEQLNEGWPVDVRNHARKLAGKAFER